MDKICRWSAHVTPRSSQYFLDVKVIFYDRTEPDQIFGSHSPAQNRSDNNLSRYQRYGYI